MKRTTALSRMSLIATASPGIVRDLGAWLTSVRAEARTLGYRSSSFASLELGELMEDEVAGHGFSIRESDPDFDAFNTRVEADTELSDEEGCAVGQPYWTTTGDDPVIDDQYVCADKERSAGGWIPNDMEPHPMDRLFDEPVIDLPPMQQWSEFQKYLARAKNARGELFAAILFWLRQQTSADVLKKQLSRFRQKNRENFRRCARLNDWTSLWLNKDQVDILGARFSAILSRLP